MGAPSKYKTIEVADTLHWCQRIHSQAEERLRRKLTPREVAKLLYPDKGRNAPDSSIRQFERWSAGDEAPVPDTLRTLLVAAASVGLFESSELPRGIQVLPMDDAEKALKDNARLADLLPNETELAPLPPSQVPYGLRTAQKLRLEGPGRVQDRIKAYEQKKMNLCMARSTASKALRAYAEALAAAVDLEALDLSQKDSEGNPYELSKRDMLALADRMDRHVFPDLSPWSEMIALSSDEESGAKVVQLRVKTKASDSKTKKADERKSR